MVQREKGGIPYFIILLSNIIPMKKIKDYPNYHIRNDGFVIMKNNKIKATSTTNKGYERITLSNNGKKKTFSIHRLVAIAFIPNPNNLPEVNHIDGNKMNNNYTNLEWISSKDNIKHSFINRLSNYKGERNGRSKLSNTIIQQIRLDFSKGEKRKKLAIKYNISYSHIVSIISNKRR